MGAKDNGVAIPARGEMRIEMESVERTVVWEMPDIFMIEETAGVGIATLFQPDKVGIRTTAICICCGLLYLDPTITPPRVARWMGKPMVYLGPTVGVVAGRGPRTFKTGQQVDVGDLYVLVRHFLNKVMPSAPKVDDEGEGRPTAPPVAASSAPAVSSSAGAPPPSSDSAPTA